MLCVTEDAGPDQKAQRLRLLSHIYGPMESGGSEDPFCHIWYWDISCLVHQFNLIVGSHLGLIDHCLLGLGHDFKYYSSLAKLIHSWRSIPSAIMSEFPPEHFASMRLPPAPCASRWGCVHELEAFLLAIGPAEVQAKFPRACALAKRRQSCDQPASGHPVDEVALDEYRDFQVRMGRYMTSANQVVKDAVFWFMVLASFVCKEPLIYCYAWLQKPQEQAILTFVTGKAFEFLQQLQSLASDLTWVSACLRESGADASLTPEAQSALTGAALKIALHNAAAYERRIYEYVTARLAHEFAFGCAGCAFAFFRKVTIVD